MLPLPISDFKKVRNLDTIVRYKRVQKQVTYFCTQPSYVAAKRQRTTARLSPERATHRLSCSAPLRTTIGRNPILRHTPENSPNFMMSVLMGLSLAVMYK